MFTGIVEHLVEILDTYPEGSNQHFILSNPVPHDLYIDQSIAHNGVCLTVVEITERDYKVTAVEETLKKTNLGSLKKGDFINFERAALASARVDGHWVQGHVDTTILCTKSETLQGSWLFEFEVNTPDLKLIVPRGSVCLNGVSLTIAEIHDNRFTVTIIPYTFEHTNFRDLKSGDKVNVEFDILGKYVVQFLEKMGTRSL